MSEIWSLKALVFLFGALLTVGAHAITGLRIHKAALKHAPAIASLVPRDGGAILGIVAGAVTVALWFGWPF